MVFCKKGVRKNFANFTGKHVWESLLNQDVFRPATLLKESQTKAFYCEICEIFKNIYFEQYMRTTESVVSFSCHLC